MDLERAASADWSRSVDRDGRRRHAIQVRLRLPRIDSGAVAAVALCSVVEPRGWWALLRLLGCYGVDIVGDATGGLAGCL
jgi:hypothetical protein